MKIVLYSHSFLPSIGGRELVMHFLAESLNRKGVNVRVVGPAGFRSHATLEFPYSVHRYPQIIRLGSIDAQDVVGRRRWALEQSLVWRLRYDLMRHGADLIHAHTTYPAGFTANLTTRGRIPLIITPHGVDIHEIPDIGHGLALIPGVRKKIAIALNAADAVTAISESIANSLRKWGVPPERIVRIDNGVDLNRFDKVDSSGVRGRLGIPEKSPIVLNVGNFHPRKGQDVLVRAAAQVREKIPNVCFVIVGRGTEALREEANRLGLERTVVLPGELPAPAIAGDSPDDLGALYKEACVFVSSGITEGSEGLSLAVLEAMAARCAIVATDISGNRDVVRSGFNGELVMPGSESSLAAALTSVLSDPVGLARLAEGARRTAEKYSWDRVADEYLDLYQRVLSQRDAGLLS